MDSLKFKPTVIVVSEVNAKSSASPMQDFEFNIEGYVLHSLNVGIRGYRGINIYVDISFTSSILELSCDFSEFLCVIIRGVDKVLTLCAVYRSPCSDHLNDSSLFKLLNMLKSSSIGKCIIIGDFNFCNVNWNTCTIGGGISGNTPSHKFLAAVNKNFLTQHVLFTTRVRGTQTPHTLDLVLTFENFIHEINCLSPIGKSDHCILDIQCDLKCDIVNNYAVKYNYNKCDYNEFSNYVEYTLNNQIPKPDQYNVNTEWLNIKQTVDMGVKNFVTSYNSNSWRKKSSWKFPVNSDTRTLIKKKHSLWQRYMATKDVLVFNEYKNVRNRVKKETRNTVQSIQRKVAESCKTNPKSFWQYIKSKTSALSVIGDLKICDGKKVIQVISDDLEKAEAFSDHFSKVYTVEVDDDFLKLPCVLPSNSMDNITFTDIDVMSQLNKLKLDKSPGPDMLHPRVLHELREVLAKPLTVLFNQSLQQGILPDDWKMSTVTAVFKKGRKDNIENYRPISLTCISCKIMESIIRNRLLEFFNINNLFSAKQFGFVKGRSTVLQQLNVLDDWSKLLESKGQIDIIYTDLEKAFDKVPHQRLLSKLHSYGINMQLITWVKSYLNLRMQRVKINNILSDCKPVLSGIPQGSVLGPLLFVIFINDMPLDFINNCNSFLYADDAKLYKHILCDLDSSILNSCCQNLFDWCRKWLMSINVSKCKVLSIAHNKSDIVSYDYGFNIPDIGFVKLDHVDSMSDLGVVIDSGLTFSNHIYEKINVAYKMLGIINRNFKYLDKVAFMLLYKSLVRSHMEFAHSVWSPYKKTLIYDIEKVQKRATKMVQGCSNKNYKERLQFLKLPTLLYRRLRGDMIEVFKIINCHYDSSVTPVLTRNTDARTRGNAFKLKVERCHYDMRKYSFCNRVINIWNSLPDYVVCSCSLNSFKNNLDKHWEKEDVLYNYEASLSASTCNF